MFILTNYFDSFLSIAKITKNNMMLLLLIIFYVIINAMSLKQVAFAAALSVGVGGYVSSVEAAPMPIQNPSPLTNCEYVPPKNSGEYLLRQATGLSLVEIAKLNNTKPEHVFMHQVLIYPCKAPTTTTISPKNNSTLVELLNNHTLKDLQIKTNQLLNPIGMPSIKEDGKYGPLTERAICAVESLEGIEPSRAKIDPNGDIAKTILKATTLQIPNKVQAKNGYWADVNETCQTATFGRYNKINYELAVSTGKVDLDTPTGNFRATHYDSAPLTKKEQNDPKNLRRPGWHDSIDSPSPSGLGNMYKPIYINASDGGVAFHGSDSVPTYPASHKCIRTNPNDQDKLIAMLGLTNKVAAYSRNNGLSMSVVIEGNYDRSQP